MVFDFSICEMPTSFGGLILDTIFYINGDGSYATPHKPVSAGKTYFLYTIRGNGIVSYDGQTYAAAPNSFLFMQPTCDFSYRCRDDHWEFWWFEFYGESPCAANKTAVLSPSPFILSLMSQSLQYAKNGHWDIACSLFCSLMQVLHCGANQSARATYHEQIVRKLEDYIRQNINSVTVHELSEVFCIEERTLRNIFIGVTGFSPKRIIIKVRMELASHLLLSTVMTLDDISRQLGFSSQYHFSKAFKAFFDISPARYRKLIAVW